MAARISKELAEINRRLDSDEPPLWDASPAGESLFTWDVSVSGPEGSPYEGGRFPMSIVFPEDYPFRSVIHASLRYFCHRFSLACSFSRLCHRPPKVLFSGKAVPYHPGVGADGRLCLRELQLVADGGAWCVLMPLVLVTPSF